MTVMEARTSGSISRPTIAALWLSDSIDDDDDDFIELEVDISLIDLSFRRSTIHILGTLNSKTNAF